MTYYEDFAYDPPRCPDCEEAENHAVEAAVFLLDFQVQLLAENVKLSEEARMCLEEGIGQLDNLTGSDNYIMHLSLLELLESSYHTTKGMSLCYRVLKERGLLND